MNPDALTGTLRLPDVAHPIGTTRMSGNPAEGVVDRDAGSSMSVRCSSPAARRSPRGQVNPTQTIVALTIRLAEHLRSQVLGRPSGFVRREGPSVSARDRTW